MEDMNQEHIKQTLLDQHARWNSCAVAAIDSTWKLFELNLQASKRSLDDSSQTIRQLLSANSALEVFNFDQELLRERVDQVTVYAQEIGAIVAGLAGEIFAMPVNMEVAPVAVRATPRAPARRAPAARRTTAAKSRSR